MKSASKYIRPLARFLLGVYLLSCMKLYLPYINYIFNYNYIATVLCENKNRPEQHCKGKCHLRKEIKKAEPEVALTNKGPVGVKIICLQELPLRALQFQSLYKSTSKFHSAWTLLIYSSPSMDVNQPPP